jgi:hypothetical protein
MSGSRNGIDYKFDVGDEVDVTFDMYRILATAHACERIIK